MRSWFARHPVSFMALYTVFYLTAFHWLEVNVTVPAIWVHCQLDDVIPFCKYAIVPYFAWFAWIPFTLFYLLLRGDRSDFWRVCLCLFAGMTIALSCYVLLPTGLALRPYRVEELRSLRNQVRCTWLRHEPLRIATDCSRALLP